MGDIRQRSLNRWKHDLTSIDEAALKWRPVQQHNQCNRAEWSEEPP